MKKICLSIPIHTALDVVQQHIENILFFVKNSIIVLHVTADQSQEFFDSAKSFEQKYLNRVFVNSKRYKTHCPIENVLGLASIHASNYEYIKSIESFDVFSIHASNEMFVRFGVEKSYDNFSIGLTNYSRSETIGEWNNSWIKEMKKLIPVNNVYWGGVVEGTFFDKNIMEEVSRITLALDSQPASSEPLVFNTIALNVFPELVDKGTQRVTFTTLSEIVNDNMIWSTINGCNGHENCYALKTVPREINHPTRIKINNILKEKYGQTT